MGDRKVCRFLDPVRQPDTVPLTPFGDGRRIQSRNEGVRIMAVLTLACTRLHAPVSPRVVLARYRHLRRIAGPVAAFRLTFGRRAVQ